MIATSRALHLAVAAPAAVLAATPRLTVATAVATPTVSGLAGAAESPAGATGIAWTIHTSTAWTISSTGAVGAIIPWAGVAGIAWPAGYSVQ
jgi:hypothetical protein